MSRLRDLVVAVFLTMTPGVMLSQSGPTRGDREQLAAGSLGPGDVVYVQIWREPELSDSVPVDNAGMAVFPKLGPMDVTGILPDSLKRLLVGEYSQFLQSPSIRITVKRRITIWGAVVKPGPYPVDLTMSITDALALAGGATSEGKSGKVELRRGSERRVIDLSGNTQVGDTSLRSGDQLFVPQRSWASRNTGLVIGAIGTVTSLVYLIAR